MGIFVGYFQAIVNTNRLWTQENSLLNAQQLGNSLVNFGCIKQNVKQSFYIWEHLSNVTKILPEQTKNYKCLSNTEVYPNHQWVLAKGKGQHSRP